VRIWQAGYNVRNSDAVKGLLEAAEKTESGEIPKGVLADDEAFELLVAKP
jgi:hypothetical protein